MGFSVDDAMCRVDFFEQSGRWYTTEAVKIISYVGDPDAILRESLIEHFKDTPGRLGEMTAVCIEPYNKYAVPVMVRDWNK